MSDRETRINPEIDPIESIPVVPEASANHTIRRDLLAGLGVIAIVIPTGAAIKSVHAKLERLDQTSATLVDTRRQLDHAQDQLDDTTDDLAETTHLLHASQKKADRLTMRNTRLSSIVRQEGNVDHYEQDGSYLKQPNELRGAHIRQKHTSHEAVVRNSLVAILSKPKDGSGEWQPICSGAKIATDKVLTANHCLEYNYTFNPEVKLPQSANVAQIDQYDYAIANPHFTTKDKKGDHFEAIAYVTAESVPTPNVKLNTQPDIALLEVTPAGTPRDVKPFKEISNLPVDNDTQPIVGETIVNYSSPYSVSKKVTRRHLRYLGPNTIKLGNGRNVRVQEVGSTAYEATDDSIQHGGSGSFGIGKKSGYIYGPLSGRMAIAYQHEVPSYIAKDEKPRDALDERFEDEWSLNVDVSSYRVLGYLAKRPTDIIKKLIKGLNVPSYSFSANNPKD